MPAILIRHSFMQLSGALKGKFITRVRFENIVVIKKI